MLFFFSLKGLLYSIFFNSLIFHFIGTLIFGLKPEVGDIRMVRHCLQTIIFQVEWLIATLIVSSYFSILLEVCFQLLLVTSKVIPYISNLRSYETAQRPFERFILNSRDNIHRTHFVGDIYLRITLLLNQRPHRKCCI